MRLRNVRVLRQGMPASFHTQDKEYRSRDETYTALMKSLRRIFQTGRYRVPRHLTQSEIDVQEAQGQTLEICSS